MPMDAASFAQLKKIQLIARKIGRSTLLGDYASAFKGAGLEFDQLREYIPGDDVRTIDWNASARTNEVMVKKFIQERDRTVLIALDVSSSMFYGSGSGAKNDLAQTLAGAIGSIAISNHDKVGAILFSDVIDSWIAPVRGQSSLIKLAETLGEIDSLKPRKTNFGALTKFLMNYKNKRGVILFVISDWIDEKLENLKQLAAVCRQYDVIAFSVLDPREQQLPAFGLLTMQDSESGSIKLIDTRNNFFRHAGKAFSTWRNNLFSKHGIDAQSFVVGDSWISPLIRFFHMRTRRQI